MPVVLAIPPLVLAVLEVVGPDAAPITVDVLHCTIASNVVRLVSNGIVVGALFVGLCIAVVAIVPSVRRRRQGVESFAAHHLVRLGSIGFLALAGVIIISSVNLAQAWSDARVGSDLYSAAFPILLMAIVGVTDWLGGRTDGDRIEVEERLLKTQRLQSRLSFQDMPLSAFTETFRFGPAAMREKRAPPAMRAVPTPPPIVAIPRLPSPLPPVYARNASSRGTSPSLLRSGDVKRGGSRNTRFTTATVWSQPSTYDDDGEGDQRTVSRASSATTGVTLSAYFVR